MQNLRLRLLGRLILLFSFIFLLCFSLGSPLLAQDPGIEDDETAATNPKDRETIVTASVPDNIPPSTPILIAPGDGTYVTISKPALVWKESTDNIAISHYKITFDGEVLFDNIPTTPTENSQYKLEYDSITGYYSLFTKTNYADGTHTWKVTAYDSLNASATSTTWTFTIDTLAPAFVITQIGDVQVSISAQDISTVPTEPIELSANSPLLQGTGEASSTVNMTLIIPGEPNKTVTFTINSQGQWSYQLGILPRDTIIELDFIITDLAGNVSVLNDVKLLLPSAVVPPVPTPGVPGPLPIPLPGPIDIPTPKEISHAILETVSDFLPPSLRTYLRLGPLVTERGWLYQLISISALLVISLPALISFWLMTTLFGKHLSPAIIKRILGLIGLWFKGKPVGLVFETLEQRPLAYATVIFTGKDKQDRPVRETTLTNDQGIVHHFELPEGTYQAHVSYPWTSFPTQLPREAHTLVQNFYRNEAFEVTDRQEEHHLFIPLDRLPQRDSELRPPVRARVLKQLRFLTPFSLATFVVALCITLVVPSTTNMIAVSLFLSAVGKRLYWRVKRARGVKGVVATHQQQLLPLVALRFVDPDTHTTAYVVQTDLNGQFQTPLSFKHYLVYGVKYGLKIALQPIEENFETVSDKNHTIVVMVAA